MSRKQEEKEYTEEFFKKNDNQIERVKATEALKYALDIRKFEIELYWKRTTYFWTVLAATFTGYGIAFAHNMRWLSILLAGLGLVLSYGWYLANRGSKHWQQNWEQHVDMLEDPVLGPLYKTVFTETPRPDKTIRAIFTAPAPFSVSKINQMISLYITLIWAAILTYIFFGELRPVWDATISSRCFVLFHCYPLPMAFEYVKPTLTFVALLLPAAMCINLFVWGKQSSSSASNQTVLIETRPCKTPISKPKTDRT
ncbi:hypothetical protein [Kordiimonas sp.]|uniref:RipA family octameric membrane protein n=1 Tax=Kordiimonas sp. TaxID=1970157 RepID=UPI003A8EFB0A